MAGPAAPPATPEAATLRICEPTPTGDLGAEIDVVTFSFNPKELSVEQSADWESKSGKSPAPPEYKGRKPGSMTIEVFLDASVSDSVPDAIRSLERTLLPTDKLLNKNPAPPFVEFLWGSAPGWVAVVTQLSMKYTMFTPAGEVTRASGTMRLQQVLGPWPPKQNPTSGSRDLVRAHVVVEGDSLASIATAEYGTPAAWRVVADANGIDDPLALRPGTRLLLPEAGSTASTVGG